MWTDIKIMIYFSKPNKQLVPSDSGSTIKLSNSRSYAAPVVGRPEKKLYFSLFKSQLACAKIKVGVELERSTVSLMKRSELG